jgi:epsilon-lactone hydrolase
MNQSEIEAIRKLLISKPRPVGWIERRQRLDEVGSIWPVADDVKLVPVDAGGVAGEWSSVPGSDPSRVLLFLHGGGYCSGSIRSHRRMVSEAGRAAKLRTLAIAYRLAPEHPYPAALDDAHSAWLFLRQAGIAPAHIAIELAGAYVPGGINRAWTRASRPSSPTYEDFRRALYRSGPQKPCSPMQPALLRPQVLRMSA